MSEEKETCAICLEPVDEPTRYIPCGHIYHLGCAQRWLAVGPTCPRCVQPVEKLEDAQGIVDHADSYLGKNSKQLGDVLERSRSVSESSYSEPDNSSDADYSGSDSSSSASVSRSKIDIESSASYSEESDSDERPVKRRPRKRDASPRRK